MLPKAEAEREKDEQYDWNSFYECSIADMMADPDLTDEQKQELLRQVELPDDEWKPIELPEGSEPVSVTIIKMRRGEA
jgi:hypothetical protein